MTTVVSDDPSSSFRTARWLLKITAALLFLGGVGGVWYSTSLPAYKNEALYETQYRAIPTESYEEASRQFYELRDSQLTNKFRVHDLSSSAALSGLILLVVSVIGVERIRAPTSKLAIAGAGFGAAIAAGAAAFAELFLSANRGEFPYWADSLGIPLFSLSPLIMLLMLWVAAHLWFLRRRSSNGHPIFRTSTLRANTWLSFVSVISAFALVSAAVTGNFLMIVPLTLWIYFHLSIASVPPETTK